ncbi:hypothetical protein AVEN_74538-1 [Araneus ventricosus]|uniref:Uncharacterized protein n=1 Tax=Araneus ventricosus TaxID=182803 RepID=A0A4Y2GNV0_ARAVE|nr:hypothetical protein AVEN_74538-1 [Araneus ventricosus]
MAQLLSLVTSERYRETDMGHYISNCQKMIIYLCPPLVEEDMDMNTELLDDTLDEIFKETDSEDYHENETELADFAQHSTGIYNFSVKAICRITPVLTVLVSSYPLQRQTDIIPKINCSNSGEPKTWRHQILEEEIYEYSLSLYTSFRKSKAATGVASVPPVG